MIGDKKVLAIIPARGGSKGVPRKNIRMLAGKPLLAWTIEQARQSRYVDRLILSSDDPEIMNVARQWKCEVPFQRPELLAQDDTPGIEPVLHALENLPGYDFAVLLQPTSPLRSVADIDACIEFCVCQQAPACVSITKPSKSPFWTFVRDDNYQLKPLIERPLVTNRQTLPQTFALNGAVYVADINWLRQSRSFISSQTIGYEMDARRAFDIDDELDFDICDCLLRKQESIA